METTIFRVTGLVNFEYRKTREIQMQAGATEAQACQAFKLFFRKDPVKILKCEELATLQTLSAEVTPAQINLFNN